LINADVIVASQNWFYERQGNYNDGMTGLLLSTMFFLLDSLYYATENLSLVSISGKPSEKEIISSENHMKLGMWVSPTNYSNFRAVLALVGDVNSILWQLRNKCDLLSLKQKIIELNELTFNNFKDLRDFFTHLENIVKEPHNNISVPCTTNCNIEYTDKAKNCFHLIIDNETIYYSYKGKPMEAHVSKTNFYEIFKKAREIYSELISHNIYKELQSYAPPESIFPNAK
jgi:hypothetical protein